MPDEIIPHHKDELNLGKVSRDDITSRMALDLLATKKDEVLDDGIIYFKRTGEDFEEHQDSE